MIAWFGPAVLLVLLAASNLPEPGVGGGAAATAVLAEEFGIVQQSPVVTLLRTAVATATTAAASLPRELSRCRSVRGYGLPAPRAPTR